MNHPPPLDESQFAAVAAAGQLGTQAGGLILQVLQERQESGSKGDRFMFLFMLAGEEVGRMLKMKYGAGVEGVRQLTRILP
jgi:hypothetical protein